ncbi:aldo/keto reductase [Actibacterium pelagium]|nr:aldo/keto reductase [Actibacterium pelagium]
MQKRKLGADGPEVTGIGYGAMSFSDFYGKTTEDAAHEMLDMLREQGVDHIDTANVYGLGRSEQWIGSYLAKNPNARAEFKIATKAAITRDSDGNRMLSNDPAHLAEEIDKSLARMGIEQIDLFYVHRRDKRFEIEEVTETLAGFVKSGKIARFGFSEIAPSSLRRAHAVHPVAAVQSEYSLQTRSPELGLVQTCAELGVTLVAFSPVGRSLLTDAPVSFETASQLAFMSNNPRFVQPNFDANIKATDRLRKLAKEMGEPAAALATGWLLAKGDHILPIPGSRSLKHFQECLRGAELQLSASDLTAIEAALPIGWAHGDRYDEVQWIGPERYG